jgi:hypothetical protein
MDTLDDRVRLEADTHKAETVAVTASSAFMDVCNRAFVFPPHPAQICLNFQS